MVTHAVLLLGLFLKFAQIAFQNGINYSQCHYEIPQLVQFLENNTDKLAYKIESKCLNFIRGKLIVLQLDDKTESLNLINEDSVILEQIDHDKYINLVSIQENENDSSVTVKYNKSNVYPYSGNSGNVSEYGNEITKKVNLSKYLNLFPPKTIESTCSHFLDGDLDSIHSIHKPQKDYLIEEVWNKNLSDWWELNLSNMNPNIKNEIPCHYIKSCGPQALELINGSYVIKVPFSTDLDLEKGEECTWIINNRIQAFQIISKIFTLNVTDFDMNIIFFVKFEYRTMLVNQIINISFSNVYDVDPYEEIYQTRIYFKANKKIKNKIAELTFVIGESGLNSSVLTPQFLAILAFVIISTAGFIGVLLLVTSCYGNRRFLYGPLMKCLKPKLSIKEIKFIDADNCLKMDSCSICLDEFLDNNLVNVLQCHHIFHSKCLNEWCESPYSIDKYACPICKTEFK